MYLEIERRFLVDKKKLIFPNRKKRIQQAYLMVDEHQVLRVRKIEDLKKFNFENYKFQKELSTETNLTFLR